LHITKFKWFNEETFDGFLLSLLLIGECYKELDLTFAAKYYALAAAFSAVNSNTPDVRKYIPRGLLRAANYEYLSGAWLGFIILA